MLVRYNKLNQFLLLLLLFRFLDSLASLHPWQSGDVHPERERHQLVVCRQGHARTTESFHLVQRTTNIKYWRQRWPSAVPAKQPSSATATTPDERQQTDEFLREIIHYDVTIGKKSHYRNEPARTGKFTSNT